jgi:hypothetical protein
MRTVKNPGKNTLKGGNVTYHPTTVMEILLIIVPQIRVIIVTDMKLVTAV